MKLKELTNLLVTKIVTNAEAVSVEEIIDEETININIKVAEEDLGRIIGKDGKIINAIRTVVQAAGYIDNHRNVRINVDKEEN